MLVMSRLCCSSVTPHVALAPGRLSTSMGLEGDALSRYAVIICHSPPCACLSHSHDLRLSVRPVELLCGCLGVSPGIFSLLDAHVDAYYMDVVA